MTLAISVATEHSLDEEDVEVAETQEWIEALDEVIEAQGPERAQYLLKKLQERGHERALDLPFSANTPYVNTIPRSSAAAVPRRPRDRAADQEPHPLERDGDGGAGQPASTRASAATSRPSPRRRRSTRSASTTSSAAASDERPAATWSTSRGTPRRASTPAPSSRAGSREEQLEHFRRELAARRRALLLPAPLADAGLLAVPDGVDGARPDQGHLPGALQPLPGRPRPQGHRGRARLVLPRRRRDRRAGVARRDHARRPRAARQPDLRHQLQPAAPRRAGARQRQDHPGAGGGLPRRRLERDQGDLGRATGTRCSSATRRACSSSA